MTNSVTPATKSKPRRFHKTYSPQNVSRPVDPLMIPFREAHRFLQHLTGFHSREQMRVRILEDKMLRFERVGRRNEIWVHGPSVHEMAGTIKSNDLTEDQKLIKHYEEKPTNNHVTAMSAGLAATLGHAKRIFEEYRATINDPHVVAAKAKEAHDKELPEPQKPCKVCDRTPKLAEDDHRRINLALTGDRTNLDLTEEHLLAPFQGLRCTGCWTWRAHAPIAIMSERLATSPVKPEPEPEPDP
jgi:hypothetical protein